MIKTIFTFFIVALFFHKSFASQPICATTPIYTIDYYMVDYSGGPETSDDSGFRGLVQCDDQNLTGLFSVGQNTGKLYFFQSDTSTWVLVY